MLCNSGVLEITCLNVKVVSVRYVSYHKIQNNAIYISCVRGKMS